jgi:nitric oxide reductase subunit C
VGDTQSGPQEGVTEGFWWGRCGAGAKCLLLSVLALCFALQTYLVYSDPPPETPPLNERALQGRKIWHAKNCQACHQLYGMGGFLGPDLTNVTERLNGFRMRKLLTKGSGAMPAFNLKRKEIAAMGAFLAAVGKTGRGQARRYTGWETTDPDAKAADAVAAGVLSDPDAAAGFELFQARCLICHAHLRTGNTGAPDLSSVFTRNDEAEVRRVLHEGRPPKMPPMGLTDDEQAAVFSFIRWLESNRDDLVKEVGVKADRAGFFSSLPWWEFE